MVDNFADKLNSLVSLEMCHGTLLDPDRMATAIEAMTSSLALTMALAGGGESDRINHLFEGVSNYLLETAVERAPLAKMIIAAAVKAERQ